MIAEVPYVALHIHVFFNQYVLSAHVYNTQICNTPYSNLFVHLEKEDMHHITSHTQRKRMARSTNLFSLNVQQLSQREYIKLIYYFVIFCTLNADLNNQHSWQ